MKRYFIQFCGDGGVWKDSDLNPGSPVFPDEIPGFLFSGTAKAAVVRAFDCPTYFIPEPLGYRIVEREVPEVTK